MKPNENKPTSDLSLTIKALVDRINDRKSKISNKELIELCRTSFNSLFEAADSHLFHELAETALNYLLKTYYANALLMSNDSVTKVCEIIKPLSQILPTQTWSSPRQIKFQQSSMPPTIAYLLTYLLNLKPLRNGIRAIRRNRKFGGLGRQQWGSKILTNETDQRRRELLEYLTQVASYRI